ncbi:MAG: hypothetical protein P8Y71_25830 [Pseudolabrys sp.]
MLKRLILGAAVAGVMASPALAVSWYPGGGLVTNPGHQVQQYKGPIGRPGASAYTAYRALNASVPYNHYDHPYHRGY